MDFNGLGPAQVFARSRIGEFRSALLSALLFFQVRILMLLIMTGIRCIPSRERKTIKKMDDGSDTAGKYRRT